MTVDRPQGKLRLTGKGMANIAMSKTENDFTFIVGNKRYDCPWFVADFLSPRVGRLHTNDPSVCELALGTSDSAGQFGDLISLGRGCDISLTSGNRSFLISIAAELENFELYWSIQREFDTNISSFCSEFETLTGFDFAPDWMISFVASHFFEIDRDFLIRLPISTFEQVISHESLQITSEDSFYEFVISRIECAADSVCLLCEVRFEYLSCESIASFETWSIEHFEDISASLRLWRAICVRLSLSVSPSIPNSRSIPKSRPVGRVFSPSTDGSLDGIISHLSHEHGGNVHDRGIVSISASSICEPYAPKNAADLETETYFESQCRPDQSLCYDFMNQRLIPTHYTIRTHPNNWFLRSWTLEGSIDGSSWIQLDDQKNNATTNSGRPIGTFAIPHSSECRFIRLRQTGKNASWSDYLILQGFEVFGELVTVEQSRSN
jgi:hypothetical protein